MKWFRLYTEILDDPKLYGLSLKERYVMILLMCVACELEDHGEIALNSHDLASRVRCDPRTIRSVVEKLSKLDIISINGNGLKFINWNKRQFQTDNVNIRVRKHRIGNVTRNVTRNVTKLLHETAPETETETETDKESKESPSGTVKTVTPNTQKGDSNKKPIVNDKRHFSVSLSKEDTDRANAICKRVACKDFNPFEWIQVQKRRGYEFEEIIGVIEASESYLQQSKNRWAYLEAVMKTEGAEIRARRKVGEEDKLKVPFDEIVTILKKELKKGG